MSHTLDDFNVKINNDCSVLDFGGDLGQFFPSGITGKKYLLDPSSSVISGGIIRVNSLESLDHTVDLVMNCHTLEHLPLLHEQVPNIAKILSQDGYIYVEVPLDRFATSRFCKSTSYLLYLRFLRKFVPLFICVDFLTGLYRLSFRKIPFGGIVKQSEHLNYFSKNSLVKLLHMDFRVIGVTEPDYDFSQGRIKMGRIAIVGKKS
jgi:hypothetical protein